MSAALPLLTSSRLKAARACQKLHDFEYYQGYRPAHDGEALRAGQVGHLGLEAWLKAPKDDRLAAALDAVQVETDLFARAKVEALLYGYDARWSDVPMNVLAVESQFETSLINPETGAASRTWRLGGKLDAIIETEDGIQVLEHKFTSEDMGPGTSYWSRLKLDSQVSIYFVGAKALGFDATSCLYDVIKRPAQRPLKKVAEVKFNKDGTPRAGQRMEDETPDEYRARILAAIAEAPNDYFARGTVVRLEGELDEAMADVWQTGRVIHENHLRGFAPRNVDACMRFNRACPFLPACCGEGTLGDATLYKKLESVHPELELATT